MKDDAIPLIRWSTQACLAEVLDCLRTGGPCVVVADLEGPAGGRVSEAVLSADEHARAERFRVPHARASFVGARSLVRQVLGSYLGVAPGRLLIDAPQNHKPTLPDTPFLDFSLSHSGNWVALGLYPHGRIGLDIELVARGTGVDPARMIRMIGTARERAAVDCCGDAAARMALFLEIWRSKEAVLKAAGLGFSGDPTTLETLDGAGRPVREIAFDGVPWRIERLAGADIPAITVARAP
ncbi:4'-phosphopantetheinyl transferase superfamily protein [Cognatishimia sp. F0-27]|uniref:4'-phosphopantetheinyl transferase family protein n=1 Tax=Cognatishimia sp. F0-27 TaxID=2816855 RepID=UPI001D0C1002|nr:4'-phosphopantetheinyl transferase superfamily protein [Cognatishimia sp. F0-27]MCC1493260.1 4'-phosphopantetheinyl transferase superfamily protein [Cognatishimia sp. F0-27]